MKYNTEEAEVNLLELLHVIAKRKMLIIKTCIFFTMISVAVSLAIPDIFSATAKVLPPQKDTGGGLSALLSQAGGLAALAGSLGSGGLGGGSDLYVGILKSRSVADQVIESLKLADAYKTKTRDETRKQLEKAVKIVAGKDGIISITTEDKDPKRAALIANTLVDQLGRTTVRLNLTKAGTERRFLEKRLELVKNDLKAAEEGLKSFAQNNQIVQVESQAKAAIERIARMKAELVTKEVQLAALRSYQTDENPQVKSIQTAVNRLQVELARVAGSGTGGDGIPALGSVPGVGLQYARQMRELKIQEAILEQLTKQYEVAKLAEAKDSSTMQVLDDAVVPVKKSRPIRWLIVMLAAITGFFVSLLFVFVQEYLSKLTEHDREIFQKVKQQLLSLR